MALNGKVAVIVGGSRGIGRDVAVALAEAGADIVVAARSESVPDPRLPGTIYTVAEEVRNLGRRALPVRADVTKDEDLEALFQAAMAEFGRIDIVFNNAAALVPGSIKTMQQRHIDLMWRVNLRGLINAMRIAIAPAVPQRITRFCKCAGTLRAARPMTSALSPASTRSMTMMVSKAIRKVVEKMSMGSSGSRLR